jgi:hypothetical protein
MEKFEVRSDESHRYTMKGVSLEMRKEK